MKRLRLGIVGAGRGLLFRRIGLYAPIDVVAIADTNPDVFTADWADVLQFGSLISMLQGCELDAIYIATPMADHATQCVNALDANLHVLCEIPGFLTFDEYQAISESLQTSRGSLMLAENYCFIPEIATVVHMAQSGQFGTIQFAEGSYSHDCRHLMFDAPGQLSWRGRLKMEMAAHSYPTHSLGPLSQAMGLGAARPIVALQSFQTGSRCLDAYARTQHGMSANFKHGDTVITVLTISDGALIELRLDVHSPRPPLKAGLLLQGTSGAYISGRFLGEPGLVCLDDSAQWTPVAPYVREWMGKNCPFTPVQQDEVGVHLADFWMMHSFAEAAMGLAAPRIRVDESLAWSLVVPVSRHSLEKGYSVQFQWPDPSRAEY